MLLIDSEYHEARRRQLDNHRVADRQRAALVDLGLTPELVDAAMQPLLSFYAQLDDEIAWYENRRDSPCPPPPTVL